MSITVRQYNAQVKDPSTGNMVSAGLLSSDALGAINSAKNTAVSDVQAAGAATIASIPSDYTALDNEVDDLKNALQNNFYPLYQDQTFTFANSWQKLSIYLEAGETYIITSSFSGGIAYTSADGTTNIETIKDGFTANIPFEFTPAQSANYIRVWQSANPATLHVVRKDTIIDNISDTLSVTRWNQGGVSFSNGLVLERTDRIFSDFIPAESFDHIEVGPNCIIGLCEYDYDGQYLNGHASWLSAGVGFSKSNLVSGTHKFRVIAKFGDGSSYPITPADFEKTGIKIYSAFAFPQPSDVRAWSTLSGDWTRVFEYGSLSNGANDTYNQLARARTKNIIVSDNDVYIKHISGVYQVHYFTSAGVFSNKTAWLANDIIIPAKTPFRLLATTDATRSAMNELSYILAGIRIKEQTHREHPRFANIIFAARAVDDTAYPPESKYYVQAAAHNQYDRVRFTVKLSTDNIWFCCHNETINDLARNPDGTEISGTVTPYDKTIAQLNAYDWGIKYGSRFAGMGVPLLEDGMKYAAMYNLGVTVHLSVTATETQANMATIYAMLDKYGLTDTAIIISANGHNFTTFGYFKAHNPRISYYIGGEASWWADSTNIANVKALQTEYNKIYVQLYPWGTAPTEEFIALAKENNFVLYTSIYMSKSELLNANVFNKGYGYIEANNVYMIRDTIQEWADSLIDA